MAVSAIPPTTATPPAAAEPPAAAPGLTSVPVPAGTCTRPNRAFRQLRGSSSPGEFAAAVRRAAREIGERVSCDARYVGRVEAGEIRCPNYAYERVFLHMFPGRSMSELGFAPRATVRGRGPVPAPAVSGEYAVRHGGPAPNQRHEESDVQRRAFMRGGTALTALAPFSVQDEAAAPGRRVGESAVRAVREAVRSIRVLDDRYGADALYRSAVGPLRTAWKLLDAGTAREDTARRLHSGAGELALSVGWLAHDSGRHLEARSHYAEALATARLCGDAALEAHAFCNTAFLARDAGRPREAVRAAQAGQQAAHTLDSSRLPALLALREAGGWAALGDRKGCLRALDSAQTLFDRGSVGDDPEWMSFFGEAEYEGLRAQCWSALGEWHTAARHARRATELQDPHFTRNIALWRAERAENLARAGESEEAAAEAVRVVDLLAEVHSGRVRGMLSTTARLLLPRRRVRAVGEFLQRHEALPVRG